MRYTHISTLLLIISVYSVQRVIITVLRIGEIREDNDIKQEVLAKMLNVNQTTYSRYETGDIDIPSSKLIRLAKYFNISLDYLSRLTNDKKSI